MKGKYKVWCRVCEWKVYVQLKREADYESLHHRHMDTVTDRIAQY